MLSCIYCSVELKFINRPVFDKGRLSSGEVICHPCFRKICKVDIKIATKLNKYSYNELNVLLKEAMQKKEQVDIRLNEVKSQIQKLNLVEASGILSSREVKELPNILITPEVIDYIAQGFYNNMQGLFVLTNSRLFFLKKGMFYGLSLEEFSFKTILSTQHHEKSFNTEIIIYSFFGKVSIEKIEKNTAKRFVELIRERIAPTKEEFKSTFTFSAESDILEQVEKLGELKAKGIISEDEFIEQKKKLLGRL